MITYKKTQLQVSQTDLKEWRVNNGHAPTSVTGPCPRCEDETTDPLVRDLPENLLMTADVFTAAPLRLQISRIIECECSEPHPKRPHGVSVGCGASWQITVKRSGAHWIVEAGDPVMAAAAMELAKEAAANDLKSIRATAEKWLAGVAALLGLFTLSGALVGKGHH